MSPSTPTDSEKHIAEGKKLRLGDLLVAHGVVTDEQIGEALNHQRAAGHKKLLGEVLLELDLVTPTQVATVLAEEYQLPFAQITPARHDPAVLDLLPVEFLEQNLVLPLFTVGGKLTVAVVEPSNVFLFEEIERKTGLPVNLVVATESNIRTIIEHRQQDEAAKAVDQMMDEQNNSSIHVLEQQVADLTDLEALGDQSPVIKLVNGLILSAVQEGASDIHIEPDEEDLRVRFRVDGRLHEKLNPPAGMGAAITSRIKIMATLDISERRLPQDGGISVQIAGRRVDLRVSTLPGKFGEKVVMRVIDKKDSVASLGDLAFPSIIAAQWEERIKRPNGILLVTGPTGSGKSTTLYATLASMSDPSVNICTVEDPVEYNLKGINQFQTNNKAGFTFASALRSILRQDPDVIMVGEIRDEETGRIAVQSALTGHLVFSTLHTNDGPSAVTRLIDIGIEPYLVAATLQGVLAQRLVRKVCQECVTHDVPNLKVAQLLQRERPDLILPEKVPHPHGCPKCRNTGFKGRVGLYELFTPSAATMALIAKGATIDKVRQAAEPGEYSMLFEDGFAKVAAGITTLEEVLAVSRL